jgi:hypothetical protein
MNKASAAANSASATILNWALTTGLHSLRVETSVSA